MPTAEEIIARQERFEADRSNFDTLYQDCADWALPGDNQILRREAEGTKKTDTFQSLGEDCIIQLAAGLYSYMFPTDSKAYVLRIDDEELAENDDVKNWLDKVTILSHKHLVQSNFRQGFFEYLKQLAAFGTGCQYEEKGKKQPLNFVCYHIAGIYISLDSDRNVDTVYRACEFTARQAVQEFGKNKLHEDILNAYNSPKNKEKRFKFIHAVFPREEVEDKSDPLTMPVASIYVDRVHKVIVSEGGYPEMPYQVSFFDRDALETYGRSPTMKKLPDIKMLGTMKKTRIKGWEKMCDPPVVLPDDGSIWPLATQPGGVLYKRAGGEDPTWFEFKGNLQGMQEAIAETIADIRAGYFLDLFDALIDRQNMTATEVMARVEQKMRLLTPIVGRLQSSYFNPMIHRIIGILGRAGKLPPIPEQLAGKEYRIEYLGRLALALKTLETEGFVKTMAEIAPLIEAGRMDLLDNYELDIACRDISRNNGAPATWLKDIEKRDAERQQRAQQAQAAAIAERLPDVSKAVKNVSQKPEAGSIAERVLSETAA